MKRTNARARIGLKRFVAEASGATSIEYAILASLISIAILGTVISTGSVLTGYYESVLAALKG